MKLETRFILAVTMVLAISGAIMLTFLHRAQRENALHEAEAKTDILISRNLATHSYFARELKPRVFAVTDRFMDNSYFEPAWMSSTYAIRQIGKYFHEFAETKSYYYKECAVNARSPENEADDYEHAFLEELKANPGLIKKSEIRMLAGEPYFVVLRRGESMEEGCLRCHSVPENAPRQLVDFYGPERSFGRAAGELVSAISIRIPLTAAYASADRLTFRLSLAFAVVLVFQAVLLLLLNRRLVVAPLTALREKTLRIAEDDSQLGVQIPEPLGLEFRDLTRSFNQMSAKLRSHLDTLEERVRERTTDLARANAELTQALAEVKTLSGLLPICASCRKIRDDKGYWNLLETYIMDRTDAQFTHGICPDCARRLYPDIFEEEEKKTRA